MPNNKLTVDLESKSTECADCLQKTTFALASVLALSVQTNQPAKRITDLADILNNLVIQQRRLESLMGSE